MGKEFYYSDLTGQVITRLLAREDIKAISATATETAIRVTHNRYRGRLIEIIGTEPVEKEKALTIMDKIGYHNAFLPSLMFSYTWRKAYYQEAYDLLTSQKDDDTVGSWSDLFSEITQEDLALNEIYIRLIEEQEGVKITDVAQLQTITGIEEITGVWNEEKGETVPYNDYVIEDPKAEALKQLEETLLSARFYRYLTDTEEKLRSGALYPEVAATELVAYGLPKTFTIGELEYTKDKAIGHAIALATDLLTREGRADLKGLARLLQAPYTVLLEAGGIADYLVSDLTK